MRCTVALIPGEILRKLDAIKPNKRNTKNTWFLLKTIIQQQFSNQHNVTDRESDNDNGKYVVCVRNHLTTRHTKRSPNSSPYLQHADVSIQHNIVACPMYSEKNKETMLLHHFCYFWLSSTLCRTDVCILSTGVNAVTMFQHTMHRVAKCFDSGLVRNSIPSVTFRFPRFLLPPCCLQPRMFRSVKSPWAT